MSQAKSSIDRGAAVIGLLAIIALVVWLAGWDGASGGSAAWDAGSALLSSGPFALLWIAAAIGFGWPLRRWLARDAEDSMAIQIGLGVAAMLMMDAALGALGWLQIGGAIGAWLLIGVGIVLLVVHIGTTARHAPPLKNPSWLVWSAAPAVAALLIAACSAPGWLWSTEFGGYDAMSYHLQLPREWQMLGRIQPLEHNVYSFLPGHVEAAYYHLGLLINDESQSFCAAQLLHALLTLLTAFAVGRLVRQLAGDMPGIIAGVIFLGTPWSVVVGSLAYNEMPALLTLAVGLMVVRETRLTDAARGALVGALSATACGAKLTAIGFVATPLGLCLVMTISPRRWWKAILSGGVAGLLVLLPYFLRNQYWAANPVFPFATDIFGLAHWSEEQAAIWSRGHFADIPFVDRLNALWNEFIRFGIGAAPRPDEPWLPQWTVLPWLAMAAIVTGVVSSRRRSTLLLTIVLLVQLIFWLCFTHLKSRFLLPSMVPMAALVGSMAAPLAVAGSSRRRPIAVAFLLLAWASVPVLIYLGERDGQPSALIGGADTLSGRNLSVEQRQEFGTSVSAAVAINYLLPAGSKALMVGNATPLYFRLDQIAYQTTWDRGPLSVAMREFPDQPQQWRSALRRQGFTHVLIDAAMLARWERSGWNDPRLTAARANLLVERGARLLYEYPNGERLHQFVDHDAP